jgi:hypothetical protein
MVDARLTMDGRAAIPVRNQPPAQHVHDLTECRETIMDRFFQAGAYIIYFPFPASTPGDALHAWRARFAECMRERGYELPGFSVTRRDLKTTQ